MTCDLQSVFGQQALEVPTEASGNTHVIFSARTLPVPPAHMVSDRLHIRRTHHSYQSDTNCRVDALWMQAPKTTYRHLGLLILSVVFHPDPLAVQVELTHPTSDIKTLIVEYEHQSEEAVVWYSTRPAAFRYSPDTADRHPWCYRLHDWSVWDWPRFNLTNAEDCLGTENDWATRDTVHCCGSDQGMVLFAELLLNASRPDATVTEYELEGELGFRGVGPGSAEVQLFLPGSLGWDGLWPDE